MTKLEIQAIRRLPKKYVRDDTSVCLFRNPGGVQWVLACHPKLPMICFTDDGKYWDSVRFKPEDAPN